MLETWLIHDSIYNRFEEILGPEDAEEFMKYLPATPADELATKSDIARIEKRFDGLEKRFDRFEERLNGLYETIIEQQKYYSRNNLWSMTGSLVALTAIFTLIVALLG